MATSKSSTTAKNAPVPIMNRPRRTDSELELHEATVVADWRDLSMCHRLVSGMRKRQQQLQQHRCGQFENSTKHNSGNYDPMSNYRRACLLRMDRCVESIIQTRREPSIDIGVSSSPDPSGHFVPLEVPSVAPMSTSSAPPRLPVFPDLALASAANDGTRSTRLFPRAGNTDEEGECFEGVFDLDE